MFFFLGVAFTACSHRYLVAVHSTSNSKSSGNLNTMLAPNYVRTNNNQRFPSRYIADGLGRVHVSAQPRAARKMIMVCTPVVSRTTSDARSHGAATSYLVAVKKIV